MSPTLESIVEFVESLSVVIGLVVLCFLALIVISVMNRKLRYVIALLIGSAVAGLVVNEDPLSHTIGIFALYSLTLVIAFRFGNELEDVSHACQQELTDSTTKFAYNNVLWVIALCVPVIPLRSLTANSGLSDSGTVLFGFGLVLYGFALGVWGVAILFAE